ncbi:MAG: dihydropteroate synthase, partial [Planctomycetota bacterium]
MASQLHTPEARIWQLRGKQLPLGPCPRLMGVVNVTPDSFSDGAQFLDPAQAVARALELVEAGADIIDVGAESTRPGARPVTPQEELRRVVPVIREVCRQTAVPVSIDTSKAVVAQAALDHGVEIINDITGFEKDPDMIPLAARSKAAVCVMHMQGTPATMQHRPLYRDVVREVGEYLAKRRDVLLQAGIQQRRICLDPGIGFGKTLEHNLDLLSHCARFRTLGCPLLIGHSRKGFIGQVLGDTRADRAAGTIGVALGLVSQGVDILRIHDVRPVREALQLFT